MFCLEINTKIKGSKISGILFLNFHSWNCSRILENSFREFSFPGIKKSWKILSWKKIVLEFSQNNLYFPWNLQFWNFPFLEFSTPGILSWNFLFLESYFTEFSCYLSILPMMKLGTDWVSLRFRGMWALTLLERMSEEPHCGCGSYYEPGQVTNSNLFAFRNQGLRWKGCLFYKRTIKVWMVFDSVLGPPRTSSDTFWLGLRAV